MDEMEKTFLEEYDLLGCIQCGRCTGGCPVTSGTDLNIRRLLYEATREEMVGELSKLPSIWECTACHTCAMRCPKGLKPLEVLFGLRTLLIEEGRIQKTIQDALESLFREGNPWNRSRATRHDWMKDFDVKMYQDERVLNLIFVCCTIAYDPRVSVLGKNLSSILLREGIDHGFLGEGESCCGSEALSLGEDCLFEELEEENLSLLQRVEAERIITLSPHCYITLKEDYKEIGREVLHYTELLDSLYQEGRLTLPSHSGRVSYHDPCYLGKQGGIYDEPRRLLEAMGMELIEFDQYRERSLCCGGGGGHMWLESGTKEERLAVRRVKEAKEKGAQLLVTSCPFCLLTLEDAIKTEDLEEDLKVRELLELWSDEDA